MPNKQINIPYFSLRLLTLLSYFLPFVFFLSTCTGDLTSKEAFNKQDAIQNEEEKTSNELSTFDNFVKQIDTSTNNVFDVLTEFREHIKGKSDNMINANQDISMRLLFPTAYSLSGIGTVLIHKNIFARIILGLSILLSIITLLFWRLLFKRKLSAIIISINLIAIISFIIICYFTSVTVLFGSWILLLLLILQFLSEKQLNKLNGTAYT